MTERNEPPESEAPAPQREPAPFTPPSDTAESSRSGRQVVRRAKADIGPLSDDDLYPDTSDDRPMTKAMARRVTELIKLQLVGLWDLVRDAYVGRAWVVLGYDNWDAYCQAEFPTTRLQLPREERAEVVSSLRESGLSIRAIAAATGMSHGTIGNEVFKNGHLPAVPVDEDVDEDALAEDLIAAEPPGGVTDGTPGQTKRVAEALNRARETSDPKPARVHGMDDKSYPATQPKPARPQPERKPSRREIATVTKWLDATVVNGRYVTEIDHIAAPEDTAAEWRGQIREARRALAHLSRIIETSG